MATGVKTETNLAGALAAVQASLPDVRKGETAMVRSEKGSYSYKYADLADITKAVLPLLGANGLAWICRPTLTEDQRFVLSYELRHVSGESIAGEYPLPSNGTPQAIGSAITYGRRYCLCAVTGVAADADDDGAAATAQHHNRGQEYDPNDPAAIKRWARDEQARKSVVANAEGAIASADTTEALDAVAKRITEVEKKGLITPEDAVALRQKLVLRHDDIAGTTHREDPTE